ncbi:MAG TPA: MoxR family ATPase [Saprospiraceae bacterium]|nr:MoxR family ATPase [Saprospiraceae bacterium]
MTSLKYTGEGLKNPVIITRKVKRGNKEVEVKETLQPYIPDPELVKAVNLAILIKRPLLLMGEPGCGKSILAKALAYELYHQNNEDGSIKQDYKNFYHEWNIKSSSKAKDGLYEFDAIQRLGDAQVLSSQKDLSETEFEQKINKQKYIQDRAMGLAIKKSTADNHRAILLIDEIDKADIDFPNDLLQELDKSEYVITETGELVRSIVEPIVIITSNAEKDLPDAFLRRCIYHYIKPLDKNILEMIIKRRFFSKETPNRELIEKALTQFLQIRDYLRENQMSVGKNVSTSELLDWFEAIKHYHQIKSDAQDLDADENKYLKDLIAELDKLGKDTTQIPFRQLLFKNWNTIVNFQK